MPCPPAPGAPSSGRGGAAGGAAAGIRAAKRSAVGIVGWQPGAAAIPDPPGNAGIVRRQNWRGLPARLGGRQRHYRGRSAPWTPRIPRVPIQGMCVLACRSEWERHAEVLQEPCPVSDDPRARASPGDKGPEPPAVTPDRNRNDKEASEWRPRDVQTWAMVEEVKDCMAKWQQQEDMKRAGGSTGAEGAGSVPQQVRRCRLRLAQAWLDGWA